LKRRLRPDTNSRLQLGAHIAWLTLLALHQWGNFGYWASIHLYFTSIRKLSLTRVQR
jgi:hypothetical protein